MKTDNQQIKLGFNCLLWIQTQHENTLKQKEMQRSGPQGFDEREKEIFPEASAAVLCCRDLAETDQPLLPAVAMDTLPGPGFRAAEKTAAAKAEKDRKKRKESKRGRARPGEQREWSEEEKGVKKKQQLDPASELIAELIPSALFTIALFLSNSSPWRHLTDSGTCLSNRILKNMPGGSSKLTD